MNASTSERMPAAGGDVMTVGGAMVVAYLVATFLLFVSWRELESASTLQAMLVLTYCLATLCAASLARAVRAIPPALSVPGILLVMLLYPILASPAGLWAMIPPVLLIAVVVVLNLRAIRWQVDGWRIAAALVVGAFLAVAQFHVINSFKYAFVFSDIEMISGGMFRDTAFHSAIVSMIVNHGTASTGLHGLVPIIYHVGVHRWMAALATIADAHVAMTLAMGMQLFILPMILYFFLYAVRAAQPTASMPFLVAVAGLMAFLYAQGDLYSGFLQSESYALSLTVMFAAIPLGLRWLAPEAVLTRAVIPEAIMAGLLVLAAGLIKASTGFTLAAFFISSMFVLVFHHRPLLALVGVAVIGLVATAGCLVLYLFLFNPELMPFHWLHLVWRKSLWYTAACIAVLVRLRALGFPSQGHIFVVLFTVAVGSLPGLLFAIAGAGAIYFIHPGVLIAMTMTLAVTSQAISARFRGPEPLLAMAGIGAAFALLLTFHLFLPGLERFEARMKAFRDAVATNQERLADTPFGGAGQALPLQQIADRLAAMAAGDERALVYVPPDNMAVWSGEGRRVTCWESAFTIPALTGLPMLAGIRGEEVGCTTTPYYGMDGYDETAFNRHLTADEACREAQAVGFETVYYLDAGVDVTRLDCRAGALRETGSEMR